MMRTATMPMLPMMHTRRYSEDGPSGIDPGQNCLWKSREQGSWLWSFMWLAIPGPANTFRKQAGLQLVEAGFPDIKNVCLGK